VHPRQSPRQLCRHLRRRTPWHLPRAVPGARARRALASGPPTEGARAPSVRPSADLQELEAQAGAGLCAGTGSSSLTAIPATANPASVTPAEQQCLFQQQQRVLGVAQRPSTVTPGGAVPGTATGGRWPWRGAGKERRRQQARGRLTRTALDASVRSKGGEGRHQGVRQLGPVGWQNRLVGGQIRPVGFLIGPVGEQLGPGRATRGRKGSRVSSCSSTWRGGGRRTPSQQSGRRKR